jgi:hypothetical protein
LQLIRFILGWEVTVKWREHSVWVAGSPL